MVSVRGFTKEEKITTHDKVPHLHGTKQIEKSVTFCRSNKGPKPIIFISTILVSIWYIRNTLVFESKETL